MTSIKSSVSNIPLVNPGSRKGGFARMAKHGNLGTILGRIKGAKNSIQSQVNSGMQSPLVARPVAIPKYSSNLAELIGILLGDGCINENQISISLNKKDDYLYAQYVIKLIEAIFKIKPSVMIRNTNNVIVILISRKNIVKYLTSIGMKTGNKVHHQIEVPEWIQTNSIYAKMCVRGLLDTDGCMYVDKHRVNNKLYRYLGLNFTNRSLPLLNFVKLTWTESGYHPTQNGPFSIYMRREKEIIDYMKCFGSSNPKVLGIFENFITAWRGG